MAKRSAAAEGEDADVFLAAALSEADTAPAPESRSALPPARPFSSAEPLEAKRESSFTLGLVALIVTGLGMCLTLIPAYGRITAAVVTCGGLALGVTSVLLTERRYLVPALSAAAGGIAVLLVVALGRWTGFGPWLPIRENYDPKIVKAIGHDGDVPMPAEWVDISKASWQQDDVRITVKFATVAPLELFGPNNKSKWTKEKYLQIWVQVKNSGVARQIDFGGWPLNESPETVIPKLSDSAGAAVPLQKFSGDWQPAPNPSWKPLFPGKTSEQLLIFAVPQPKFEYLKLELPGAPFGGKDPVRLLIPRGSTLYRS